MKKKRGGLKTCVWGGKSKRKARNKPNPAPDNKFIGIFVGNTLKSVQRECIVI